MFATSFRFLRQLGADATAPSVEAPATPVAAAVPPVADASAPVKADLPNALVCNSSTHVLFSVSRSCTVQPYFYIDSEEQFLPSGPAIVVPDGGAIIQVDAVAEQCFLRVTAIPNTSTTPVRICAKTLSRYGK